MSDIIEKLREDRKFFLAVFVIGVLCAYLPGKFIDMATFADLVKFTLGTYFVVNAGQKIGLAFAGSKEGAMP
jgi:hypothetical protein